MDYEVGGVGVSYSPRGMSLTLSPNAFARKDAGGAADATALALRGGSPNTVLYRAFEGVAAAGASPRTASDDGMEASAASPGEGGAEGLQRHLTRAGAPLPREGRAWRASAPPQRAPGAARGVWSAFDWPSPKH